MKNMGKKLFVTALMMLIGIASKAQIVILNDSMFEGRMSEIKAHSHRFIDQRTCSVRFGVCNSCKGYHHHKLYAD